MYFFMSYFLSDHINAKNTEGLYFGALTIICSLHLTCSCKLVKTDVTVTEHFSLNSSRAWQPKGMQASHQLWWPGSHLTTKSWWVCVCVCVICTCVYVLLVHMCVCYLCMCVCVTCTYVFVCVCVWGGGGGICLCVCVCYLYMCVYVLLVFSVCVCVC